MATHKVRLLASGDNSSPVYGRVKQELDDNLPKGDTLDFSTAFLDYAESQNALHNAAQAIRMDAPDVIITGSTTATLAIMQAQQAAGTSYKTVMVIGGPVLDPNTGGMLVWPSWLCGVSDHPTNQAQGQLNYLHTYLSGAGGLTKYAVLVNGANPAKRTERYLLEIAGLKRSPQATQVLTVDLHDTLLQPNLGDIQSDLRDYYRLARQVGAQAVIVIADALLHRPLGGAPILHHLVDIADTNLYGLPTMHGAPETAEYANGKSHKWHLGYGPRHPDLFNRSVDIVKQVVYDGVMPSAIGVKNDQPMVDHRNS